jgi:hypothetical protein
MLAISDGAPNCRAAEDREPAPAGTATDHLARHRADARRRLTGNHHIDLGNAIGCCDHCPGDRSEIPLADLR